MRIIGLLMVLFGALALGCQGLTYVSREEVNVDGEQVVRDQFHTIWVPPVVGGIVVVSGLLLVASDTRRSES
jgi:hypothetical protein